MPTSQHLERELKLDGALALALPDLTAVIGPTVELPEQRLVTTYFDTADLRLWRLGYTLRHRIEPGRPPTFTLKLPRPASGPTLDRLELNWAGARAAMPSEVIRVLRGLTRWVNLTEIAELHARRRRLVLCNADGEAWAELDDDEVTVARGAHDGLRFRQIEIELRNESQTYDAPLALVLDELHAAGARDDDRSKLARALGVHGPPASPMSRIDDGASISAFVGATIADGLQRLLGNDASLRLQGRAPDAEAVHDSRVAIRRLRADLKTFALVIDPVWLEHTTAQLRDAGSVFGAVRDLDVLRARVDATAEALGLAPDATHEIESAIDERRMASAVALETFLEQRPYLLLLDRLAAASAQPPLFDRRRSKPSGVGDVPAVRVVAKLARRRWTTLDRRVRRAGAQPDAPGLHRIRIAAKNLRYASEAAAPVVGKRATKLAAAAERLQEVLGAHHDRVTARGWLAEVAPSLSAPAAFAAGAISTSMARDEEQLAARRRDDWRTLARPARRAWLNVRPR